MRHERAGVVGTSSVWIVGPDRLVRGVGSAGLGTRSCPSRIGRDLGCVRLPARASPRRCPSRWSSSRASVTIRPTEMFLHARERGR